MVQLLIGGICFAGCGNTVTWLQHKYSHTSRWFDSLFMICLVTFANVLPHSLALSPETVSGKCKNTTQKYMDKKGLVFLDILMHKTLMLYLEPHQKTKSYSPSAFNHFRDVVYVLWFTPDWQAHGRTKKSDKKNRWWTRVSPTYKGPTYFLYKK